LPITPFAVTYLLPRDHASADLFHPVAVPILVYCVLTGIKKIVVVVGRNVLYGGTAQSHLAIGVNVIVIEWVITKDLAH
jgi:hypothetical protein